MAPAEVGGTLTTAERVSFAIQSGSTGTRVQRSPKNQTTNEDLTSYGRSNHTDIIIWLYKKPIDLFQSPESAPGALFLRWVLINSNTALS